MIQSQTKPEPIEGRASLGEVIRRRREALDWMQKDLARRAGVNPATVLRIESGAIARPAPETLVRLAEALGLDRAELAAAAGIPTAEDLLLPAFRPYLRARYPDLPPEAQQRIARYVERVRAEYGASGDGPAAGEDE